MVETKQKLNPNFEYLEATVPHNRWTLLQGGTRSGKTFATLQWIIKLCLSSKDLGLEIDIVRSNFNVVKSTVWKDMQNLLIDYGLYSRLDHNKTDHIYMLNGNTISYYGADDAEKVHGRSRDILYCNEINQIDVETIDQFTPRTRLRIIGDYNPAIGTIHWLDKYINKYPPIITTYKDNPFLTKDQVEDIESKKDQPYWWAVYGNGVRAKREGVIFTNWEIGEFDESLPFHYGLDFGFVNDPDACDKVAIDDKKGIIYIDEQFHEHGQTINDLAAKLKALPKGQIVADSAEQRLISDLIGKCNRGITSVKKGPGSVLHGVVLMQNYKIIITARSINTISEFNNYSWATKGKDKPIDDFNHHIDDIRYVVNTYANRKNPKQPKYENQDTRFIKGDSTGFNASPWNSDGKSTSENFF